MDLSNIGAGSSLSSLKDALSKTRFNNNDYSKEDEWNLTKDKESKGSAVIRFVHSPDGELFVEVRNHGVKLNGKWFIENCPKTMDWDNGCPSCEHADAMKKGREWDVIPKEDQDKIRPFFAKTSYFANVLVEKDPANPENEGKVFKFRFGKKILEKIYLRAQDDPLDGTAGINVFEPVTGASFKLVSKKVSGWVNYDDSSWMAPKKLEKGNADKIDVIVKSGHELGWLRTSKNFKEYSEMNKRFARFIGASVPIPESAENVYEDTTEKEVAPDEIPNEAASESTGDGDAFDYFKNLGEDSV